MKLVSKAEELNYLSPKSVSENVEFIAKLLIIKEEWPELYQEIVNDPLLFRKIDYIIYEIELNKTNKKQKLRFPLKINADVKISKEQYFFFLRTRAITAENINLFLKNREVYSNLPNNLQKLVLEQNWEEVKDKIQSDVQAFELLEYVFQLFDLEVIKRGLIETSGYNILSFLLKMCLDDDFKKYTDVRFNKISELFDLRYIEPLLPLFNPNLIVRFARYSFDNGEEKIVTYLSNYLNTRVNSILLTRKITHILSPTHILPPRTEKNTTHILPPRTEKNTTHILPPQTEKNTTHIFPPQTEKIITQLVKYFIEFPEVLSNIEYAFSTMIQKKPALLTGISDILNQHEKLAHLVNNELIKFLLQNISSNPNQNYTKEKIELILTSLYKENSSGYINSLINKTINFVKENTNPAILKYWLDVLYYVISKRQQGVSYHQIFTILNTKHNNYFTQQINNNPEILKNELFSNALESYIRLLILVYHFDNDHQENIISIFNFYYREDFPKILALINEFYLNLFEESCNWKLVNQLFQKFCSFNDSKSKNSVADILIYILRKHSSQIPEESVDIVKSILHQFIDSFVSNEKLSSSAKSWLKEIIPIQALYPYLIDEIKFIEEPEKITKVVEIILALRNEKDILDILTSIFESEAKPSHLSLIGDKIFHEKKDLLRDILKKIVRKIRKETSIGYLKVILKLCVKVIHLFDEDTIVVIITKFTHLLEVSNKEDILLALELLNEIDVKIPKEAKQVIMPFLGRIKDLDDVNRNKLLSDVKKKYKV